MCHCNAWPLLNISLMVLNSLSKTEFAFFMPLMWSWLPKGLTNFTADNSTLRIANRFISYL